MKILALPRYERLGPSSRVRFYQFYPALREQGFVIQDSPLLGSDYVRRLYARQPQRMGAMFSAYLRRLAVLLRARQFDLVWLEKEFLPWVPAWLEERLASLSYVVDYDDAVYLRYDQHKNRWVRRLLGGKIDRVMRNAALVVAGNATLRGHALAAGAKRVEILPSVVDAERYTPAPLRASGFNIGWVGSPGTATYLGLVKPALQQLTDGGQAKVSLVGAGEMSGWQNLPIHSLPWREATEIESIRQFDAGIMPLVDEPFERGKCGYKLIQYMACALPVVASPVGVNREIVVHGETGFLAESEQDWLQALTYLRDHPAERRQMGQAGRARFEREYSLQVVAPKLARLFLEARQVKVSGTILSF